MVIVGSMVAVAHAELLLMSYVPQAVFAARGQALNLRWHNGGLNVVNVNVSARLYQSSSTTAVSLGDQPWKEMRLLPQQTVLESATLDFPAVKAETKFLVQWLENTNRVIGTTAVWVYPTNLLAELKPMADGKGLGIYDPQNQLKPLLKNLRLDFVDLEDAGLENFSGRLAIIGPFSTKAQMPDGLTSRIKALSKKTAAVVWLLPPGGSKDKLEPSFYTIASGTNAVVVAQADLVADLPDNPPAQLNLISLCKRALNPAPAGWPNFSFQP